MKIFDCGHEFDLIPAQELPLQQIEGSLPALGHTYKTVDYTKQELTRMAEQFDELRRKC